MKYYNLSDQEARHVASLKPGADFVIVVPIEQPPKGYKLIQPSVYSNVDFYNDITGEYWSTKLPHPLDTLIGLRETWNTGTDYYGHNQYVYKADNIVYPCVVKWRSSQCMAKEAIRHWATVTDSRVDMVQNITKEEIILRGVSIFKMYQDDRFVDRFNNRYKGKYTWAQNPYVNIATLTGVTP